MPVGALTRLYSQRCNTGFTQGHTHSLTQSQTIPEYFALHVWRIDPPSDSSHWSDVPHKHIVQTCSYIVCTNVTWLAKCPLPQANFSSLGNLSLHVPILTPTVTAVRWNKGVILNMSLFMSSLVLSEIMYKNCHLREIWTGTLTSNLEITSELH